jgi:UDP-N-acetylmuramyl tripeptide synthase
LVQTYSLILKTFLRDWSLVDIEMKIINIQALRGLNIWSIDHGNLIQMRVDFESSQDLAAYDLLKLNKSLGNLLNSSDWNEFELTEETDLTLADLIVKLAVVLQIMAGYKVGFSLTSKKKEQGIWVLVFEYQNEEAGEYAAELSVKIIEELLAGRVYDLKKDLKNLKDLQNLPQPKAITNAIPIIAITGSNGKTTTTRLIAHIIKNHGYKVGFTTSNGIYINDTMISEGDTTGPISAKTILENPEVEYAVLETARGGILRSGLGFKQCNLAVVTNIQEDHLGISDIHTLDDLARVKAVVVGAVKKDGYAVLNADNLYTTKIGNQALCKVAYFGMDAKNPVIQNHYKLGGVATVVENGYITLLNGDEKIRVQAVSEIPITFGGKISFMVQNVLAATLATYLSGFKTVEIAESLLTFIPSPEQTPGRLNIYNFKNFKVMVDFAHNLDAFKGIKEYLDTVDSPQKIGIIIGTGDRRDEDIRDFGRIAAQMFDHILINQDKFLRGRKAEEIVNLLIEGIKSANTKATYTYLPKGIEPLKHAIQLAKPGAFIVALSDVLENSDELVKMYLAKDH